MMILTSPDLICSIVFFLTEAKINYYFQVEKCLYVAWKHSSCVLLMRKRSSHDVLLKIGEEYLQSESCYKTQFHTIHFESLEILIFFKLNYFYQSTMILAVTVSGLSCCPKQTIVLSG
jgi:hypothetical protein